MSLSNTDTDTITTCAKCGKEGESLKACTACKLVKYCNRDCQISHRKQHKKECKKRAAELYDEKLFKEPPFDECPICFLPMPIDSDISSVESCCGKRMCNGCIYAMTMSEGGADLCAFCRTPGFCSDEEHIKRTMKLIDNGNGEGFLLLATAYNQGTFGMPQDSEKANELNLKAGELGCAKGYYNLGHSYDIGTGVEVDKKKAKHYYELAAMMGHTHARHNLALIENEVGNHHRSFKHFMISARAGTKRSLDCVKQGFINGLVTKDEYANTLRAYQARQDEMKSDERDSVASAMQEIGLE